MVGLNPQRTVVEGLLQVANFGFKLALAGYYACDVSLPNLAWDESFLGDNDLEKIKAIKLWYISNGSEHIPTYRGHRWNSR